MTKIAKWILISQECKVVNPECDLQIHKSSPTWAIPSFLSAVSEVGWSDHKPMHLLCSCSQSWNYSSMGWFVMAMLLGVHTEVLIRTVGMVPCNTLVSGIGHNGQLPGLCPLSAGQCVLVLNSYMTKLVEYQRLHLYLWWKVDSIRYFCTLCQKCPTNDWCWAASRVGDFDYQANRKSDFLIEFIPIWATSLEPRQYAWLCKNSTVLATLKWSLNTCILHVFALSWPS